MPKNRRNSEYYAWAICFLLAILLPSYILDRTDTAWLLTSYFIGFVAFLSLWKYDDLKTLTLLGTLVRVGLFFSLPILSDDVFRFLWDGLLLKNDLHPFQELPSTYLDQGIKGITPELYERLNSKIHFTVYPPINQAVFWFAVNISENWLVATGVIRLILLAADLGTLHFLRKILLLRGKNENLAFLYFLNPLIIIEGVGNLHFEVLVVFFLVLSLYYFYSTKSYKSAIALGLAIGTKLLPLIFLPYFFFREIRYKKILFSIVTATVATIALSPLYNAAFISSMRDSLSLYFLTFEFNASIYFLVREIVFKITGYNEIQIIGPALAGLSLISILIISLMALAKKWIPEKAMLLVLTSYLLFATTVHPWYILPLIVFGLLSGYVYPLVWSLVIFITYAGYSSEGHQLSLVWIALEYIIVVLSFFFNNRLKQWLTIS